MKNFIEHDTKELGAHMLDCRIKNPTIFTIKSHLIDAAITLPNHIGALTLIFVLLMSF